MTKQKRTEPGGLQFKSFGFDTKAVAAEPDDDGMVTFKAYAAAFDNVDSHNDVIRKGAFVDSLAEWDEKGAPIPVHYNHAFMSSDPHDNMGFLKVAEEDAKGLAVEVALDVKHNPKAAYAHRLIKSDRLRELSIGYVPKSWAYEPEEGQSEWDAKRVLLKVDLFEVSMVAVASNPQATVTEKAAAFLYGEQANEAAPESEKAAEEGESDDEGDTPPEIDSAAFKELVETAQAEAIDAVTKIFASVTDALAAASKSDDSGDGDEPSGESEGEAGQKGSAYVNQPSDRTRALLASIALLGAES